MDDVDVEIAVYLPSILKILGWSREKYYRRHKELHELGVVFIRKQGRPPVRRICAFPSELKTYIRMKSRAGQEL